MPDDTQNNLTNSNTVLGTTPDVQPTPTQPTVQPSSEIPQNSNPVQMVVEPVNPQPINSEPVVFTPMSAPANNPTPSTTVSENTIKEPPITDYNQSPPQPPTNTTENFQTNDVGFVATNNEPVISTPQASSGSSTPKKSIKTALIIGIILLLSIAIPATVYLTQKSQENRSKAQVVTDYPCYYYSGKCVPNDNICNPPDLINWNCDPENTLKCVGQSAICQAPITSCIPYADCSEYAAGTTCTLQCTRGYINWTCKDKGGKPLWQPTYPNANECPGQCPWTVPSGAVCCPDSVDGCNNIGEKQCFSDPWISECTEWPSAGQCAYAGYWKWLENVEVCPSPNPTPPPGSSPGPSSTPTLGAQCSAVRIYRVIDPITSAASWTELTSAQLPALKTGDTVYITTMGSATNDTLDKARIRVNKTTWSVDDETSSTKPGSQEFYIIYIIPAGVTSFTFESEVHAVTQNNWF